MRSSRSDETLRQTAANFPSPPSYEPEPELLQHPQQHRGPADSSCLMAIGLISGTGGRVAKLVSWFPADGSTALSGGLLKPKNLDTQSAARPGGGVVAGSEPASKLKAEETEWFGLPREELASLLAPAASLCDADFDLQVDALRFIGRPMIIGGASGSSADSGGQTATAEQRERHGSEVEHMSPRRKRIDSQSTSKRLGEQDELMTGDSSPTAARAGDAREGGGSGGGGGGEGGGGERRRLDGRSSSQTQLGEQAMNSGRRRTRRDARTNSQKQLQEERARQEKEAQRLFHVVFVTDSRKMTGGQQSLKAWQALASRLTAALLLEERRTGYIAKELATMRRLREEHSNQESSSTGGGDKPSSSSSSAGGGGGGSSGGGDSGSNKPSSGKGSGDGGPQPLAQQFLEHSDLARILEALYRGLVSPAAGAVIFINGWIRLDLYLGNMAAGAQIDHSRGADAGGWGEDGLADANQSYILLRDKAALLAELPAYASPAVRAAIERANPFFRMHNLAENMGIATERLTTVVRQLVQWKVARVVDKFDGVTSRFIAAPNLTMADVQQRLAPQFVAAQLLATMRSIPFSESSHTPAGLQSPSGAGAAGGGGGGGGPQQQFEVGASLSIGEPPLLSEETVAGWVSTLGVRWTAVRLLAVPLLYQAQRRATNDVDYNGPSGRDGETQERWWQEAHTTVATTWPGQHPIGGAKHQQQQQQQRSGGPRWTREDRQALLAEIKQDEFKLHSQNTPIAQELRAAGKFSVLLSAVHQVLEDIQTPKPQRPRQWDVSLASRATGGATGGGQMFRGGRRTPSPTLEFADSSARRGGGASSSSALEDQEADGQALPVELGICEVLSQFGMRVSRLSGLAPAVSEAVASIGGSERVRGRPKSIAEMTEGPLADGKVARSQNDVIRLLTWLLQKDAVTAVWEHYYLCIPTKRWPKPGGGVFGLGATSSEDDSGSGSPRTPTARSLLHGSSDGGSSGGGSSNGSGRKGGGGGGGGFSPRSLGGSGGPSEPETEPESESEPGSTNDSTNSGSSVPVSAAASSSSPSSSSSSAAAPSASSSSVSGSGKRPVAPSRLDIDMERIQQQHAQQSPRHAIAKAAGLSLAELDTLTLLQRPPAQDDNADDSNNNAGGGGGGGGGGGAGQGGGAGSSQNAPQISEAELQIFLSWCPLLRGGCRVADLTNASAAVSSNSPPGSGSSTGAGATPGSGGGGGSFVDGFSGSSRGGSGGGGIRHRAARVEQILQKFSSCLVKMVHE